MYLHIAVDCNHFVIRIQDIQFNTGYKGEEFYQAGIPLAVWDVKKKITGLKKIQQNADCPDVQLSGLFLICSKEFKKYSIKQFENT